MGLRRKAHSITDLWLLDAPVASEINTRVYMYTFLRAAARQCRDPSQAFFVNVPFVHFYIATVSRFFIVARLSSLENNQVINTSC